MYSGVRAGLQTAVLAFEPRRSDLPLQVAFPILLANLTGELLGGSTAPIDAVAPGTPVRLTIPQGADGVSVRAPDGSVTELLASLASGASVTYASTTTPGIYAVTPILPPAGSASPSPGSSGATPRPTASAAASGGPSASPSTAPVDPDAPVYFAVDLFDVGESTIAPGSVAPIEALGIAADPLPTTGGGVPVERPTTRDELWVPIVLLVLVGLCVEWAVFHRDAVVRIRRSLGARFGRPATDGRT